MTHALHYGSGVFEGIAVTKTRQGFRRLPACRRHLKRFAQFGQDLPHGAGRSPTAELTRRPSRPSRPRARACYIRPLVYSRPGADGGHPAQRAGRTSSAVCPGAATWRGRHRARGRRLASLWRRAAPRPSPATAKATGNDLNALLIKMEALGNGYRPRDRPGHPGHVSEGAGEKHLLVKDGALITPRLLRRSSRASPATPS